MKKIYLSLLFSGSLFSLAAQEVKWQKDLPSLSQDILTGMSLTPDRQILLSGSSIRENSRQSKKSYDYHVVKLSQEGYLLWEKYYGGSKHDYLNCLTATSDGGFLMSGTSVSNRSNDKTSNNSGGSDVWILRLDENGEEIWQRTLGTISNDELSKVAELTGGGFFTAGNIVSDNRLFGSKDVFVSKLDGNGKLEKTTILGGLLQDEITDMIPTPDGGAILVIYSLSGRSDDIYNEAYGTAGNKPPDKDLIASAELFTGKTEENFGKGDYWVVKLDEDANVEWQKAYGGVDDELPKSVVFTDEGYIIGGEIRKDGENNLWILSIDKSGNKLWENTYSFGKRDVLMSMDVIRQADPQRRGLLLGGYTEAEESAERNDEKFWMLYTDSKGNEEWRKYAEGSSKKKEEHLVSAKLQNDGSYILAGTSGEKTGSENWKVIKLADKQLEELMERDEIRIYPNPAKDYCYVEIGFPTDENEEAEILLHDMGGKRVQTTRTKNVVTKLNLSGLPPGAYMVTVKTLNKSVNSKILKK